MVSSLVGAGWAVTTLTALGVSRMADAVATAAAPNSPRRSRWPFTAGLTEAAPVTFGSWRVLPRASSGSKLIGAEMARRAAETLTGESSTMTASSATPRRADA